MAGLIFYGGMGILILMKHNCSVVVYAMGIYGNITFVKIKVCIIIKAYFNRLFGNEQLVPVDMIH